MSIPWTDLDCDKCGFHGDDSVVLGNSRYVDGDCEIRLRKTLGWCSNCKEFVPIEHFEDNEEVAAEIEKILDGVKVRTKKRLSISLFGNRRKERLNRLEELPGLIKRLVLIEKRKGREKCLHCGSVNVSRFDGDYSQIDPYRPDGKSVHTGYLHPGCGGEILATASPMRFFNTFEAKLYSINGDRIEGQVHLSSDL